MGFDIDVDVDTSGLDGLFDDIEALDGKKIGVTDLFPARFMERYTDASSFEEFVEQSPFDQDFEDIPDGPWDDYVRDNTRFNGWDAMQEKAGNEWLKRQL